ncbi:MAG: hypothetical protein ACREX4_10270 [Gammaproteobacteria bacterium]
MNSLPNAGLSNSTKSVSDRQWTWGHGLARMGGNTLAISNVQEEESMANPADFVGTWYFRGYQGKPCTIRLTGANRVEIRDEHAYVFPARIDGYTVIPEFPERPSYPTGVLSSDLQTIQWTNGEPWKRRHD